MSSVLLNPSDDDLVTLSSVTLFCSVKNVLSNAVQNLWRQKKMLRKKLHTAAEGEYEKHFGSIYFRDSTSRYIVRLPFKNSTYILLTS